jgi:hypothetical protein
VLKDKSSCPHRVFAVCLGRRINFMCKLICNRTVAHEEIKRDLKMHYGSGT